MPANYEMFELWWAVRTLWRAGFGLIGLDYSEVRAWAEYLDIEMSGCNWRKIKALENWYLEENRKRPEDKKGHGN